MFDYQSQLELSNRLAFYKAYHQQKWIIPRNDKWGQALFYASVLHQSSYSDATIIDKNQLEDLAQAYDKQFNVKIDINSLIDDNLIRIVFGKVNIPVITNRAIDTFNRLEPFFECEFPFFLGLSDEQIAATKTIDDLTLLVGGSESQVGLTLNQTQNIFWKEVDGRVEIPLDETFQKIFDDKNKFGFLSWLGKKRKDHNLRISRHEFEKIRDQHALQFTLTPSLNAMVGLSIIRGDDSMYQLLFPDRRDDEQNQGMSIAILWERLLDDERFSSDYERLQYWYYRTVYHMDSIDVGSYLSNEKLVRFLDAAHSAILQDSDIASGNREYFRLVTDNSNTCQLSMIWDKPMPPTSLDYNGMTPYQVQRHLSYSFYGIGEDMLLRQNSRVAINYFIHQIIKCDPTPELRRLNEMFELSTSKPYIFWKVCMGIRYSRPELISYLVNNPHTVSLSYILLLEADFSKALGRQVFYIRKDLIQDYSRFILEYLSTSQKLDKIVKAKTIFECLLYSSYKKFRINKRDNEDFICLANDLREALVQTTIPGVHYDGAKKITLLFIAEIIEELIEKLENYLPVDALKNRLLHLPYVQLDLATWLMEVIPSINLSKHTDNSEEFMLRVCTFFSKIYLETIKTTQINAIDYFGDKTIKPVLPSWADYRQNDRLIGWGMACLNLSEQGLLHEFLSPSLIFISSEDPYNKHNNFIANKLRAHLFVLIDAFNGLFTIQQKLNAAGRSVKEVLITLEIRIREIILKNSTNNPGKGKVDIFGESFEHRFLGNKSNELIPIIASIINRFSKESREKIINALTQSDQFVRSLKMLDRIVSENERSRLLKMITGRNDFDEILEKLSFQDLQFVTSNLSGDDLFISEAENALKLIEKKAKNRNHEKNENEVFIFHILLLIAYHKRDLSRIDTIEAPSIDYVNGQKFHPEEEKDFYRALVLMKTDHGEESYKLYDQLISNESNNAVIALNRFAAKLQWAKETGDLDLKKQLCRSAIEEWRKFDSANLNKETWPDIAENITFILLEAHKILEEYNEFDKLYVETIIETRMRPEFLEIRVDVLMERNHQYAAEQLLIEAKLFHQLSDGGYPGFINNLEDRMNTSDIIEFLTSQYDRIYRLRPEDLIKLIPPSVNGGKDLAEFLFNELIGASKDVLGFINSLPDVEHEDKYSDLLMLSLNGRLRNYTWHVTNLRFGYSDPEQTSETTPEQQSDSEDHNLGLIDFAFCSGQEKMAICEAFKIKGKNTIETQKHNLKVFNYDPARRLYFLIIYFTGGTENFKSAWKSYKDVVEEFIEFPTGYELNGKLTQLANQPEHDGIQTGLSLHNENTKLYHVFINVNYRLQLKKKPVRKETQKKI